LSARVLLVSWESAERELVERLLDAGELPALARLRADGRWREVASPNGFGDDSAWMSFCTGVDLDVHERC